MDSDDYLMHMMQPKINLSNMLFHHRLIDVDVTSRYLMLPVFLAENPLRVFNMSLFSDMFEQYHTIITFVAAYLLVLVIKVSLDSWYPFLFMLR